MQRETLVMMNTVFPDQNEQVLPRQERSRFTTWPKVGICLEEVMAFMGRMENAARTLREDEQYAEMYTIEEQIQRASDNLRFSIRTFEKLHGVKIEIFTFYSPFKNHTKQFIPTIKKPQEIND